MYKLLDAIVGAVVGVVEVLSRCCLGAVASPANCCFSNTTAPIRHFPATLGHRHNLKSSQNDVKIRASAHPGEGVNAMQVCFFSASGSWRLPECQHEQNIDTHAILELSVLISQRAPSWPHHEEGGMGVGTWPSQ